MKKNKLNLKYPLVVEGKYDKIKLSSIILSPIIVLNGFSCFNNPDTVSLLRNYTSHGGIIILTDSDNAGAFIRSKLKSIISGNIINLYTPSVQGREKRKVRSSSEGILGVEGTDIDVLYNLLKPYEQFIEVVNYIDLNRAYADGLAGSAGSANLRKLLAVELKLPPNLSPKAFYQALNNLIPENKYISALKAVNNKGIINE